MKILFCSPTQLSKELGAAKVTLELAEEMARLGWQCEFLSPTDCAPQTERHENSRYQRYLREQLQKLAGEFEVVEYDHSQLPFPRRDFPAAPLFVARSVLLAHHFANIAIPHDTSMKSKFHQLLQGRQQATQRQQDLADAHRTVSEADLVNVLNEDDQVELVRCGIPKEKIVVLPGGISPNRRALFDGISSELPPAPVVAFIGTFDTRKGATDFPTLVQRICAAIPNVGFRLLGTYKDVATVRAAFPKPLRQRLDVVSQYHPDELPELLAPCSVGLFPSYIEGFGLGVLEMLAASIPVIAYHTPGPPMMLPAQYLVQRGDTTAMSDKVIQLLQDRGQLQLARRWAKQRSQEFCWQRIATQTSEIYTTRWLQKNVANGNRQTTSEFLAK
ncbi:MAG: glycosyltransferase family 4 protein [Acidobacteria bacterium]|nr:glycosyltransferase family 4 protein [Acidobacteriota bacterium]